MRPDPKSTEVRREVGWMAGHFVEILIYPCQDRRVSYKFEIDILVNGESRFGTFAQDLLEAQMLFDALEQRLRSPSQRTLDFHPVPLLWTTVPEYFKSPHEGAAV